MRSVGFALVLALTQAGVSGPADAHGRHRHFRGDVHDSRRFDRYPHRHRGFRHRPAFPVFVSPSLVVTPPVLVTPPEMYAGPGVYPAAPAYAPPVYAPPAAYGAPGPPPMPRVVEFPAGRYELRGDGVYSPYTWVWVPNPPMAPPQAPPAPPAALPAEPAPARRPSGPTAAVYRWTDEQGVTTWTDRLEKVPARYRGQADRLAL